MVNVKKQGKVIFIGAGPGDPELITLKAVKYLNIADIVLTDRLVSERILNDYVGPMTRIIYVGKQCRKGHSTLQESINDLMVSFAREGKMVVRLKGGDVSIFSNILDELKSLAINQISYEIIPGITAALGAAAYAGIPLTARNYSAGVRILTCYSTEIVSDSYWKELAESKDTLVFYMSTEAIGTIVDKLTINGINKDCGLAVIEQATTPFQKVYTCSLYEYNLKLSTHEFISPSLIIIGKVVQLFEQFKWLENTSAENEYFKATEEQFSYRSKTMTA